MKINGTQLSFTDTALLALIERAQFSVNKSIYKPGMFKYEKSDGFDESFLEYFLGEVEKVHGNQLSIIILNFVFKESMKLKKFKIHSNYIAKVRRYQR